MNQTGYSNLALWLVRSSLEALRNVTDNNRVGNYSGIKNHTMIDQDTPSIAFTPSNIAMVIACFVLIVVTIGGNTLVILAFHIEPALQVITNHWIVSLALTDIMLAAVVMPLQISRELFDGKWIFGSIACDIFISLDVLCCTCSIYHLCLISLDRYFCVTYPISYPRIRTPKATLTAICATWFWCISISFPRLLGWKDKREDEYACHMTNVAYMVFSSAVSFYIPLFLICIMYYGIYRVTRAQSRKFACLSSTNRLTSRHCLMSEPNVQGFVSKALIATTLDAALSVAKPSEESRSSEPDNGSSSGAGVTIILDPVSTNQRNSINIDRSTPSNGLKFIDILRHMLSAPNALRGFLRRRSAAPVVNADQSKSKSLLPRAISTLITTPKLARSMPKIPSIDIELASPPPASPVSSHKPANNTVLNHSTENGRKERMQKARLTRRRQKQETRAAKVVVIVLAAFVFLWAPFFIVNVVEPLCGCSISNEVWKLVTWLGYCNSSINPFIYTCFNRTFRRAFFNVFATCCPSCKDRRRRANA